MTQNTNGRDELHLWFGLSRATFLTLPRTFMQAMPDEWQGRMAQLLNEFDDHWDWDKLPTYQYIVQCKYQNKFTKMDYHFTRCRFLNSEYINSKFARKPIQTACKD